MHLVYHGAERRERTERDVEPYGLFQQGGAWYLVGWCRLREAIRTFHVARIESLAVNAAAPRTPDFARAQGLLARRPRHAASRGSTGTTRRCAAGCGSRPPASAEVLASFGPRARIEEEGSGAVVEVEATNVEGLLRHVLALGDRAEVLSPKPLRERAREVLAGLARGLA